MALDREPLFTLLSSEFMSSGHIDLLRSFSEKVDDDGFSEIVTGYLTRPITVKDVASDIYYLIEDACSPDDFEDSMFDDRGRMVADLISNTTHMQVKEHYQYLGLLADYGSMEQLTEMLNVLADSMAYAQKTYPFNKYADCFAMYEKDLRGHIASGDPTGWFDVTDLETKISDAYRRASEIQKASGRKTDKRSGMEAAYADICEYIPRDTMDELYGLLVNRNDDDRLKEIMITEVLDDLDYDIDVSTSISCALDRLFDDMLDEGFPDDDEVERYLKRDWSRAFQYIIHEFSEGCALIYLLEHIGMHREAVSYVENLAETMDRNIKEHCFFDEYVEECLVSMSKLLHESASKDDSMSWMTEDVRNLKNAVYGFQDP
ncbi:MAG: hypothetical protein IKA33_02175 [Candidatus Methanomethylophilaceae archaeon]|nr:hypothetical protein [Candidatus Methanomethylophilaceae archaeon]MBR7152598.1 hypothetical protein [Candidatus Methanomethylophilaceae archaeon]